MPHYTYTQLEKMFTLIPWRQPVQVVFSNGRQAFCCRFCIAQNGLNANDASFETETQQDAVRHIEREHPRT